MTDAGTQRVCVVSGGEYDIHTGANEDQAKAIARTLNGLDRAMAD